MHVKQSIEMQPLDIWFIILSFGGDEHVSSPALQLMIILVINFLLIFNHLRIFLYNIRNTNHHFMVELEGFLNWTEMNCYDVTETQAAERLFTLQELNFDKISQKPSSKYFLTEATFLLSSPGNAEASVPCLPCLKLTRDYSIFFSHRCGPWWIHWKSSGCPRQK